MSETHKNKEFKPEKFLLYRRKKMTDEEKNAFERYLQKNPFAEEAVEGFNELGPEEAQDDLLMLKKKIDRRSSRPDFRWFAIAASVAVLMLISSLFLLIDRQKPADMAYAPVQSEAITKEPETRETIIGKPESQVISEITAASDGFEKEDRYNKKENKNRANTEIIETITLKEEVIAEAELPAVQDNYIIEQQPAAPIHDKASERKKALSGIASGKETLVKGRILSSEDDLPVPGASIVIKGTKYGTLTDSGGNFSIQAAEAGNKTLIASMIGMESTEFRAKGDTVVEVRLEPSVSALSEIVVVGYGTQKKSDLDEGYVHSAPEPVTGQTGFNRYIRENIRRPDTITAGQRLVVVLNFIVSETGHIDSLRVVRSPGKTYSDEAIRLIMEGPAWKAATENGVSVSQEVRVRVVFR